MRFSIVAHRAGETNIGLITRRWRHFEPLLLTPREALTTLAAGDAALGRLDIRQGLDGIEDGLWALSELSAAGVRVLNPPAALILGARQARHRPCAPPRRSAASRDEAAYRLGRTGLQLLPPRRQAALWQLGA
jgi:hypothetical protein